MELIEKSERASTHSETSELIRKLKPLSEDSVRQIYIPLQGTYRANSEEKSFDLTSKLKEFFEFKEANTREPTVMLLLGDAGSGKSVFAQQLYQQCWQDFKIGNSIPIWISLPELDSPFERAVEEALEKCGLSESQIEALKSTERFLFIVDGYDELHNFQNCYESNQWSRWKAKVLITCRTQALYYQRDYEQYFTPFEDGERQSCMLTKVYVAPFNQDQIRTYIGRYQALNPDQKLSPEDIAKIPNLNELITSPFMLHMAVGCLSEILAKYSEDKLLQVNLYDIYIEQWFIREAKKVAVANKEEESEEKLIKRFWQYCKDLAVEMHSQKLDVIPYSQRTGRRFGNKQAVSIWERFFTAETVLERSACPLRSYGENNYGFVHATLVNYFATRTMYDLRIGENREDEKVKVIKEEQDKRLEQGKEKGKGQENEELQEASEYQNQSKHPIHRVLFTNDPESVQMLAERIQQDEQFKQQMLWCIEESKRDKESTTAAANAITALIRAGVKFNRANLSGVSIQHADISGGYFDKADLSYADLSQTKMHNIWLRGAQLHHANVTNIDFGEGMWFLHESQVLDFVYREDLQRIFSVCRDNIYIWDSVSGEKILDIERMSTIFINAYQYKMIKQPRSICVNSKGDKVALIGDSTDDDNACIVDIPSGAVTRFDLINSEINCIAFSTDDNIFATACDDGNIYLLSANFFLTTSYNAFTMTGAFRLGAIQGKCHIELRKSMKTLNGHAGAVYEIAFSSNNQWLASGGEDKTVRVWDVATYRELKVLAGHQAGVTHVAFTNSGTYLASASADNMILVWTHESGNIIFSYTGVRSVENLVFSTDDTMLMHGSKQNAICIHNFTENKTTLIEDFPREVKKAVFSHDGKKIVSGGYDDAIVTQNIESKRILPGKRVFSYNVMCLELCPASGNVFSIGCTIKNSQLLVEGRVFEKDSGTEKILFFSEGEPIHARYSPSCRFFSWQYGNHLTIFNVMNLKIVGSVNIGDHSERRVGKFAIRTEFTLVYSSSEKWCAWSNNHFSSISIMDLETSNEKARFVAHDGGINTIALSSDEKYLASGGKDGKVRVWNAVTFELIREFGFDKLTLKGLYSSSSASFRTSCLSSCLLFSPDNNTILMGGVESDNPAIWGWQIKGNHRFCIPQQKHIPKRISFFGNSKIIVLNSNERFLSIWNVLDIKCEMVINFHTIVNDFSYHPNGSLALCFGDGSVEYWQNIPGVGPNSWQFQWSSNLNSKSLYLDGLQASNLIGLSDENRRLLEQRMPKEEADDQSNTCVIG